MVKADPAAFGLAFVGVLLLLLIGAFAWYHWPGSWEAFEFYGGSRPAWPAPAGEKVNSLRFEGCTFTTANPQGEKASFDVTPVLNGMAVAYDVPLAPGMSNTLFLGGSEGQQIPLNPFSFVIPGFNDRGAVPDSTARDRWKVVPPGATKLTGRVRAI